MSRHALTLALLLLAGCASFEPVCEPVSAAKLGQISAGLAPGADLVLRDAVTVPRTSTREWHFVTAELDGPGFEGDGHEATWIVSSLNPGSGAVLAVDSTANK